MTTPSNVIEKFLLSWNDKATASNPDRFMIFSPTVIINSPLGKKVGMEELMGIYGAWIEGFPNLELTHLDIECYGNTIITNCNLQGTHLQTFQGIPPTEKNIQCSSEMIFCFQKSKIIKQSTQLNMLDIYHQLGLQFVSPACNGPSLAHKNKSLLIQKIREFLSAALTKREVEMLSLYLIGLTAKQIANFCHISHRTVETHLLKALHHLGCNTKCQCLEKVRASLVFPSVQDLGNLLLTNFT